MTIEHIRSLLLMTWIDLHPNQTYLGCQQRARPANRERIDGGRIVQLLRAPHAVGNVGLRQRAVGVVDWGEVHRHQVAETRMGESIEDGEAPCLRS